MVTVNYLLQSSGKTKSTKAQRSINEYCSMGVQSSKAADKSFVNENNLKQFNMW